MAMIRSDLGRRDFLASGGALAFTLATGGCEQILQDIANRPTRRNIAELASNDPILQTYRSAISQMQALPKTDNRNWTNQASIHYNSCPHGTWFLLPWHRAYLVYFERICQKLTGNATFALPYWNWTDNPAVPDVFYASGDVLNDTTKVLAKGTPIPAEFVSHSVLEGILEETNFQIFGSSKATTLRPPVGDGPLEATPHNNVHGLIGGDMGTYMSPLDPVFWTHHAMLDFCWVDWNFDRNNQNPNDPTWTDLTISNFFDENGNPVNIQTGITQLFPIFTYQYEPSQIGATIAKMLVRSQQQADQLKAFVQKGGSAEIPVRYRFALDRAQQVNVGHTATARIPVPAQSLHQLTEGAGANRLLLTLQRVEPPAAADFFVRVFVNAPETVSAATPITDPHYAGSFGFFLNGRAGMPGMAMGQAGYMVDVTTALQQAGAVGHADIQLVAVPYPGRPVAGRGFAVGGLELAVTELGLKKPN
jgi:tyrosinase